MKPSLELLPGRFAVVRLKPDAAIPDWFSTAVFSCLVRSSDELSLVCDESRVPAGFEVQRGWILFRVEGQLDFSLVGLLAGVASTLARSQISLLAVSSYLTDYFLVLAEDRDKAIGALENEGYGVARA